MKRIYVLLMTLLFAVTAFAQGEIQMNGAFHRKDGNVNHLWLLSDGYCSYITYEDNKYLGTWGGPFTMKADGIEVKVEYNDLKPEEIGTVKKTEAKWRPRFLEMGSVKMDRVSLGKQDLDGLWRITGRKQGDKVSEIAVGDRKTIKILVDGYFQWIAINPAEKGFYGTGGGKYVFKDGKYTEEILFFSRDNSRVGAKLGFDGKVEGNNWNHSGLSSKGDPIFEVWSRDKTQYGIELRR